MDYDLTKRRLLQGAGLGLAGLAGCLTTETDGPGNAGTGRRTETAGPTETATATETDTATETETETATETPSPFPWFIERGEVIDDFSTFDIDWTVSAGTAEPAEEGFLTPPAVKMESAGDSRARIGRSFSAPQDFSDVDFSLAVKLFSSTKEMFRVSVLLRDANGVVRIHSNAILPSAAGGWMRFDMAFDRETGEFDPSAVTDLWVQHWAGEGESSFLVDDLRTLPKPETGAVLFTFDDACAGDYEYAYPLLSEYGYTGVCFPPTNQVTETSTPSIAQYQEMQADGWDIEGHTPGHERLSDYSKAEQRALFEENVAALRKMGFAREGESVHFRTPYGNYDSSTLDVVLDSFDTCISGAGTASGTSFNLTDPRLVSYRSGEDMEQAKELIDDAAEHRQLLGLTFHTSYIDRDYLETIVKYVDDYVQRGDLRVITMSEYYDEALR